MDRFFLLLLLVVLAAHTLILGESSRLSLSVPKSWASFTAAFEYVLDAVENKVDCVAVLQFQMHLSFNDKSGRLSILEIATEKYKPVSIHLPSSLGQKNGTVVNSDPLQQRLASASCLVMAMVDNDCTSSVSQVTRTLNRMPFGGINNNNNFFAFLSSFKCHSQLVKSKEIHWNFKYKILMPFVQSQVKIVSICMHCDRKVFERAVQGATEKEELFADNTKQLNGHVLQVSLATKIPGIQVKEVNGKLAPFKTGGHHLPCLMETAKQLNFSTDFFTSTGAGTTGLKLSNGTWTGVVGDVLYSRADIGMASLITWDRYHVVRSVAPMDYLSVIFVHANARDVISWAFILWPFSVSVWCFVAVSSAATIACMWLIVHVSRAHLAEAGTGADIFMAILGSCFNQSNRKLRKTANDTMRVPIMCWSFFAIVISTAYASRLFALYMNAPREKVPSTFHELAESDFEIGMSFYGGALYNLLQRSQPNSAGAKIFSRVKKMKPRECIDSAVKAKFACITYDLDVMLYVNTRSAWDRPAISVGRETAIQMPASAVLPRSSILKESMDSAFIHLSEAGLVPYWRRQTFFDLRNDRSRLSPGSTREASDSDERHHSLGLNQISGVTITFMAGLTASFFVFMLETGLSVLRKLQRRSSRRNIAEEHLRYDNLQDDDGSNAIPVLQIMTPAMAAAVSVKRWLSVAVNSKHGK